MEYRCPKCDAVLNLIENKYKCEYCKSEYDKEYFTNKKDPEYIIPFKLTKENAINIYKKNIKSALLTRSKYKHIDKIEGVYIPCYIYDLDCTGEVEFECNKNSTWKSSGKRYIKEDSYKIIRGANMSLSNMPIVATTELNHIDFGLYNYNELLNYDLKYLEAYKSYDLDKTKDKLLNDINEKAKDSFINEVKKDIKDYDEIKHIKNSINIYNPRKKLILLPIWILKNREKTYIINAQNGYINIDIPIEKNRYLFIWLALFMIIFVLMLLISLVIL